MEKIYRVWMGYGKNAQKWLSTTYVEESALNTFIERETTIVRGNKWTKKITFLIDFTGWVKGEDTDGTIHAYTTNGYEYNYKVKTVGGEEKRRTIVKEAE